jgi:signal transduction histidine kinase
VETVQARAVEPVRRRRSARLVAGVSGGLADHLGVDVFWVRAVFAALAALNGVGVLAYGLFWLFVPQRASDAPEASPTARERQQAVGLAALGIGLAVFTGMSSESAVSGWVTGPIAVALVGAAVVWREADEAQRRRWRDGARTGRVTAIRVLAGVALVAIGIGVLLFNNVGLDQMRFALLAVAATLIGVGVLTVPLWIKLVGALGEERRARIRTEERAEIAAHLHDSVLQTLALIQKQADAPREVRRLARGQERQLRGWLYGPSGYGREMTAQQSSTTLAAAVAAVCGEVEDAFAISVQQVVVGDCAVDERVNAVVQATREAVVNAAKHAGVSEVSVYGEVEADRVNVFVRDRGAGFDPDDVPDDRHGLADSIRGRMDRHGGRAGLRTAPGEGTEVHLEMPRKTEART